MEVYKILAIVLTLALMPIVGTYAADKKPAKEIKKQTVVLSCELHCQACCDKIMKNIAWEKGVKDLVCDLKTKTVTVTYDPRKTTTDKLLDAFARIDKPAKVVNPLNPNN